MTERSEHVAQVPGEHVAQVPGDYPHLHDVPLMDLVAELEHRGATRLVPHEVYIGSRHFRYGGTYSRPMTVLAVFTEGLSDA